MTDGNVGARSTVFDVNKLRAWTLLNTHLFIKLKISFFQEKIIPQHL